MKRLLFFAASLYAVCVALIGTVRALAPHDPPPYLAAVLPGEAVPVPPSTDHVFSLPPGARLGEVVVALGPPDAIGFTRAMIDNQDQVGCRLYYRAAHLIVYGWTPMTTGRLAPHTPAWTLEYSARPWTLPQLSFPWRGLGPFTRYYPQGTASW